MLEDAARRGIHIVPTLHMFVSTVSGDEGYIAPIRRALRGFIDAGGHVLFGTDVGYLGERDTGGEFEAMHAAGMSSADILRSLTSAPAAFFRRADGGTVRVGSPADMTILETSQAPIPSEFANVHAVIRGGTKIYG